MNQFISFSNIKELKYGGKANNLALLFQNKFRVPDGFVISSKLIEKELQQIIKDETLSLSEIKEKITQNKEVFNELISESWQFSNELFEKDFEIAVRSSANLEDGSDFSFAGQFTSVLQVDNFGSYKNAFITCLLSKYNEEAHSYCLSNHIDPKKLQLNIVVQEMVQADYSGVCFSVNPMTGNEKEMIIESVSGLGEKLVQGQETPNTHLVNWYEDLIEMQNQGNQQVLSDSFLKEIVEESLKIQQYFGLAQDIEWAIKGEKLYILQARPLTAIQFKTKYDWTNADLKDGGVSSEIATPFMYKLYEYAFVSTMSPYLKSVKIHPPYEPDQWYRQFMLYSYWNLTATKDGVKKIPGFIEKEFDEDLGITPIYNGKGHITKTNLKSIFQGIQILLAINKSIKNTIKNAKSELARIDAIIHKNKTLNWSDLNDEKFVKASLNLVKNDYINVEGSYFVVIYNNSNLTTLFKDLLEKKNKTGKLQYLKLITGLQNLSHLQPSFFLWNLSRKILKDKEAFDFFNKNTAKEISASFLSKKELPFKKELQEFIDKYGFHSEKELNILTPNWHENPEQAIGTLKSLLKKTDDENLLQQNENQKKIFEEEFSKIKSNELRKEIIKHRYFLWLREEYRDRSSKMYDIIRSVYLEAGKRLVKKGILQEVSDIFFVEPKDIKSLFNKDKQLLQNLENNKIIFRSFRNFKPPNEIWSREVSIDSKLLESSNTLKGIACSFGIVEGKVFVAKSVKEAANMPEGMIMLTQFTDPAWTVHFSKIIGLVTETGGILSHGAIISREYGIPAILGVKNATKTFKTGDLVRIDGGSGLIELIETK